MKLWLEILGYDLRDFDSWGCCRVITQHYCISYDIVDLFEYNLSIIGELIWPPLKNLSSVLVLLLV